MVDVRVRDTRGSDKINWRAIMQITGPWQAADDLYNTLLVSPRSNYSHGNN